MPREPKPPPQSRCIEIPKNPRLANLLDKRFERLVVIGYVGRKSGQSVWLCDCDCGGSASVSASSLTSGRTRSCGCLNRETSSERFRKHDKSQEDLWRRWKLIIRRTTDKNFALYHRYGGRGIVVCDRWLRSFSDFVSDMGPMPSSKHTIERSDNNGNYEPGNCRWATMKEQANNTSRSVRLNINGKEKTMEECEKEFGVSASTIKRRRLLGWTDEESIAPIGQPRKKNRRKQSK